MFAPAAVATTKYHRERNESKAKANNLSSSHINHHFALFTANTENGTKQNKNPFQHFFSFSFIKTFFLHLPSLDFNHIVEENISDPERILFVPD